MSRCSNDEPRVAGVVGEVGLAAADEIVDDADAIAALEQQIDHVAADEAGAAGDDGDRLRAHAACSFFMRADVVVAVVVHSCSAACRRVKARQRSRTASSIVRLGAKPSTR